MRKTWHFFGEFFWINALALTLTMIWLGAGEVRSSWQLLLLTSFLLLLLLLTTIRASRKIARTLEDIRSTTQAFARGRFNSPLARNSRTTGAIAKALDEVASQVKHVEAVRRDFIANVSHELRTPITSIRGFVETLLDSALENEDDARRFLGIIQHQSERLARIIDDLMLLAWVELNEDRAALSLELTNIKTFFENCLSTFEPQIRQQQMAVQLDVSSDCSALLNTSLMEHAIGNLLSNSIRYSPAGSELRLSAHQIGEHVELSVADRGPGIPPEHQARIFERFYVVDKARSRELGGTGLGLAIVKHIALAHGGTVRLDSVKGEGSTFTLVLPRSYLATQRVA